MSVHPIIAAISAKLFEAEERRLNGVIIELNRRNKRAHEKSITVDGFLHQGRYYLPRNVSVTVAGKGESKTPLHLSLYDDMERHLEDRRLVEEERKFISQVLYRLLRDCKTQQEIRDALPECLTNLAGLTHLNRQQEPAWTLREDPRALRQYEEILPKMEVYCAARLIY